MTMTARILPHPRQTFAAMLTMSYALQAARELCLAEPCHSWQAHSALAIGLLSQCLFIHESPTTPIYRWISPCRLHRPPGQYVLDDQGELERVAWLHQDE